MGLLDIFRYIWFRIWNHRHPPPALLDELSFEEESEREMDVRLVVSTTEHRPAVSSTEVRAVAKTLL
jgi:hypothetical protein